MNLNTTHTQELTDGAPSEIIKGYTLGELLNDRSPMPEELIAGGILPQGETILFSGTRRSSKTSLLLNWMAHMTAGKEYLSMKPTRPLRVIYLHGKMRLHQMFYRIKQLEMDPDMEALFRKNFMFIPHLYAARLDESGTGTSRIIQAIRCQVPDGKVDLIVLDPLLAFFDGSYADMDSMMRVVDFERNKLEVLRNAINPKCGIILVHNTKKLTKEQMEQDPFYEVNELRNVSSTDISFLRPYANSSIRKLVFELNYGPPIKDKFIDKVSGKWTEVEPTTGGEEGVPV